jgi:hypothetical protein
MWNIYRLADQTLQQLPVSDRAPDGATLVGNTVDPDALAQVVVPVPEEVTRFQARAALHLSGLLSTVEAVMTNEQTPVLTRLAWVDALSFKRHSPAVVGMAQTFGWSDSEVDDLFRLAQTIEV